jgi:transposase, IS30 family
MNNHNKISFKDREQILKLINIGDSVRQIAVKLGKHPSSISREIHRSGMNRETYSLCTAQVDRNQKASLKGRKAKLVKGSRLLKVVKEKILQRRWSPEQVSGYFKRDRRFAQISHESIYRYIYSLEDPIEKEEWIKKLRRRKKRRSRKGKMERRGKIPNRVSIHQRPQCINDRTEEGHWEGDLVIGERHASAIGTAVERLCRLTIIVRLQNRKTSDEVVERFSGEFAKIPKQFRKSMTYDNGTEMSHHDTFTMETGMPVYFADPGSPGQRGTNENTNGLIREFFPKGTDFNKISEAELKAVEQLLNQRPRKVLGFATPEEVYRRLTLKGGPPANKHRFGVRGKAAVTLPRSKGPKGSPVE